MRVITDIKELLKAFGIEEDQIDSDFHIFKLENYDIEKSKLKQAFYSDLFEITLVIEDDGHFTYGENSYHDINQTICFLSPGQLTSYRRDNGIAKGYSIHFKSSFLSPIKQTYEILTEFNYFKLHSLPLYKLNKTQLNEFTKMFMDIYKEFELNDNQSINIIRLYLNALLYKVNRIIPNNIDIIGMSRSNQIANMFEELLYQHSSKYKLLSEYASLLNISSAHLSDCVKKTCGKPAKQVVIDHQVLKAKSLLTQSNLSIKEVAFELGYADVTNFTKFVKKHLGVTPKEFRHNP
ncbi:MAG: helix-turn-helix domain-containing protein [Marinifilaceae bacterium]|jgi:AraC-like DNA-binding protein|nr:helix-turn-helix domain-containing protein [Marinifilaceae bacterium]